MAYTEDLKSKNTVTWDNNPYSFDTHATIVDGELTELVITGPNQQPLLYSTDMTYLSHVKQVIADLETILLLP